MAEETDTQNSSFVWDQTSQLYFHASSGFYYNPEADWYYSSRDGLYYTFDNGSYVLLSSQNIDVGVVEESCLNEECSGGENWSECDGTRCLPSVCDESNSGRADCRDNQAPELPPPPSEWLEETLINLYLSGHNRSFNATDDPKVSFDVDGADDEVRKLEEDDGIAGVCGSIDPDENITAYSEEEENWRLQYGQVVHSGEESALNCVAVDLWDWEISTDPEKAGQCQAARLVGHLVKQSNKRHPSMPSGGGLFKTAPICEVHLDLVRVRTGKVYKLRSPSVKYLTSVPTYDSSNPAKDWGFPELSMSAQVPQTKSRGEIGRKSADSRRTSVLSDELSESKLQKDHQYRDRAMERRRLHGGFGIGHGQKSLRLDEVGGSSSPISSEEAAAEALDMSLGPDSYARKILQNMGWKEGEGLGKTTKGLVEPLKPVGNVGTTGLGWKDIKRKVS